MAQSCTNLHQGVKHISHRKDRSLQKKGPDDTKPPTFTTFKTELPKHIFKSNYLVIYESEKLVFE